MCSTWPSISSVTTEFWINICSDCQNFKHWKVCFFFLFLYTLFFVYLIFIHYDIDCGFYLHLKKIQWKKYCLILRPETIHNMYIEHNIISCIDGIHGPTIFQNVKYTKHTVSHNAMCSTWPSISSATTESATIFNILFLVHYLLSA